MHGKIDVDFFLTIVMFTIVIMKTYVVAAKRDIVVMSERGRGVISRRRGLPKRVEFKNRLR